MSAAQRNRGARAEVAVVNYLRTHGWPDARRYLAGDGRQPGDIDAWPGIAIEVKDRAASSWPSWCAQAVVEAGHRIPVVVRRTRGTPDVGQWETRVPLVHWYDMSAGSLDVQSWPCPTMDDHWLRAWAVVTFAQLCDLIHADTQAVT